MKAPLWLEISLALLFALVASNAVTFALTEYERANEIRTERQDAVNDRLSALMALLAKVPEADQAALFKIASVRRERISVGRIPKVAAKAVRDKSAETRLKNVLGELATGEVRVAKRGTPEWLPFSPKKKSGIERFSIAVELGPDRWLNAEFLWPEGADLLPGLLLSAAVAGLALLIVAVWLAFRFSGPLRRLSDASVKMAEGQKVDPIPERGPAVLKTAARSFNAMSRRLTAMLDNQKILLGSIAHDLRTPITSLRLKAEFIDDDRVKHDMQTSLDELHTMTEAAFDAARTGMGEEPPRNVDVAALVESVCADLADLGGDVAFVHAGHANATVRPNDLKRATRNLIENAVKYGTRARVAVTRERGRVVITVDDDGPGLSTAARERMFEPFVRGDAPAGTRGSGLGLTLARAVARNHQGDVTLENRKGGGLRAQLTLAA